MIPFVSRDEHLEWREQWKRGRWVRLSWPPEEREAILRQDQLFRQADAVWAERHGTVEERARVLPFSNPDQRRLPALKGAKNS